MITLKFSQSQTADCRGTVLKRLSALSSDGRRMPADAGGALSFPPAGTAGKPRAAGQTGGVNRFQAGMPPAVPAAGRSIRVPGGVSPCLPRAVDRPAANAFPYPRPAPAIWISRLSWHGRRRRWRVEAERHPLPKAAGRSCCMMRPCRQMYECSQCLLLIPVLHVR